MDVVTAGIPSKDGCPVLTRIKAFVVDEGVAATLEHVFRDRAGNPIDLTTPSAVSESSSLSVSSSVSQSAASESAISVDSVVLRVKEFTGCLSGSVRLVELAGVVIDASGGVVRAALTQDVVKRAGIYQMSWAFIRDGAILVINEGLLSVERSLFGTIAESPEHVTGPPTINELRMQIMDSSAADNLLLDDVEFTDEQIAAAIIKPVQFFNEVNPPLRYHYTTLDFPWKHHWLEASIGYLLQFAAHNYRRNRLDTQAGGVKVDDKNKEAEYLRASQLMLTEWKDFVKMKKLELNMRECVGGIGSSYG